MTQGKHIPASASPPTAAEFAAALAAFEAARLAYVPAKEALDLAQVEQAAAINALPPEDRADAEKLQGIADRLQLATLGDDAFEKMSAADDALEALVNIPCGTPFELFQKMHAVFSATWETGDHTIRLLADACGVSLLFGAVWLARWTNHGGSVTVDPDNPEKAWIGHPCYSLSPTGAEDEDFIEAWKTTGLAELTEDQRAACIRDRRSFNQHFWEGKMRELSDFLDALPSGLATVRSIVAGQPAFGMPRKAGEAVRT
jgi:hypothetical protein